MTLVTGAVQTRFWNNVEGGYVGVPDSSPYQPIKSKVEDVISGRNIPDGQPSAEKWAKAVTNDLLKSHPPSHVRHGLYATYLPIVSWLAPSWLLDWISSRTTDLARLKTVIESQESKKEQ